MQRMITNLPDGYIFGPTEEFFMDSHDTRWPGTVAFHVQKLQNRDQGGQLLLLEVAYENYFAGPDQNRKITELIGIVQDPKLAAWLWMHQRPAPPKPAERPAPPRQGLLWHLVQAVKAWNEYGL